VELISASISRILLILEDPRQKLCKKYSNDYYSEFQKIRNFFKIANLLWWSRAAKLRLQCCSLARLTMFYYYKWTDIFNFGNRRICEIEKCQNSIQRCYTFMQDFKRKKGLTLKFGFLVANDTVLRGEIR
jgi:hypothetical protein